MSETRTERQKYELMWELEDYRKGSPEMSHLPELIEFMKAAGRPTSERPSTGESTPSTSPPTPQQSEIWPHLELQPSERRLSVNIYGCGPGRSGLHLALLGHEVHMLDIAQNALDPLPAVATRSIDTPLYFHRGNIVNAAALLPTADVGYCCDVLEHLPTDQVAPALSAIARLTPRAFMTVCHQKDSYGKRIDDVLHLTVEDHAWWLEKLKSAWPEGTIVTTVPNPSVSLYMTEPS